MSFRSDRSVSRPLSALALFLAAGNLSAQVVRSRVRLDDSLDPFERCLGALDRFGSSLASLGDLNGDGLNEFAVGASGDNRSAGSVWIFSLTSDRQVSRFVKLGPRENLPTALRINDEFGDSVVALGDLDGNGVVDLAVGAPGTDVDSGVVHLLFLNALGQVREQVVLGRDTGIVGLENGSQFGSALAAPGDLDGNGVPDLLVGLRGSLFASGGFRVLYLGTGGTLVSQKTITSVGNVTGIGVIGSISGPGKLDVAVGFATGSLQYMTLDAGENVIRSRGVSAGSPPNSAVGLGDVDGNGVPDFAAGRSVYLLDSNGLVISRQTFSAGIQGLGGALAAPGDTNGNGRPDLVVGAPLGDTRGRDTGAVVFYDLAPTGVAQSPQTVDATSSRLTSSPAPLQESDGYGLSTAPLGDLDLDGQAEVAVGAPLDDDVATDTGAIWVHFVRGASGVRVSKIGAKVSTLGLQASDRFGSSVTAVGDLDGNGTTELLVGAPGDDDGIVEGGAAYVLFLRRTGVLERFQKISRTAGSFVPGVNVLNLGKTVETISDLDRDGRPEVILAGELEAFVLFLTSDGTVRRSTRIDRGLLPGLLVNHSFTDSVAYLEGSSLDARPQVVFLHRQGRSLWNARLNADGQLVDARQRSLGFTVFDHESLGDLDGNGFTDLALADDSSLRLWSLGPDFLLLSELRVREFNLRGLGDLGDLTGDGVPDLAVGVIAVTGGHDRSLLLELGGIASAGFERRDALDNLALENGRQIPRPHPGRTFVISSEGANLGAAIFDSTPGGPNAASQDPDLLVGSGNVLMLQDSLTGTQSVPGIFDRPNDDRDGGMLALDLPRPVRALSIELIDQDTGLGTGTTVTLIDENGRTRTYYAPPGFTEDVHQTGTGGWRTLRLDTLNPQPGYLATATASQQPGFLDSKVRRIEVQLSGSGAIDDFLYDPWP